MLLRLPCRSWNCRWNLRLSCPLSRGCQNTRPLSTSSRESPDFKTWSSLEGGNIKVDVYRPEALCDPRSPLVIYLPPTGFLRENTKQSQFPSFLTSSGPPSALACINYRWSIVSSESPLSLYASSQSLAAPSSSNHYPWPLPLHNILHAYDFLINASKKDSHVEGSPQKLVQRPIIIYGEFLSAALALSLALTESKSSRSYPTRIAGVIVKNGIYDWTNVATSKKSHIGRDPKDIKNDQNWPLDHWGEKDLHDLKDKLFMDPMGAFDSFASPELFFRTPGWTVPTMWPGTAPSSSIEAPSSPQENFRTVPESRVDLEHEYSNSSSFSTTLKLAPDQSESTRISHLKYPPTYSDLKIPPTLFLYSSSSDSASLKSKTWRARTSIISPESQAHEMAKMMQRSVSMHEYRDRVMWDEDADPKRAAEERVRVEKLGENDETEMIRRWIDNVLT